MTQYSLCGLYVWILKRYMQYEHKSESKLKKLRVAHGYTQDFVASRLGIARQTYSHYETGQRMPPYDVMQRLAALYGISLDYLNADNDISGIAACEPFGFVEFLNDADNRQKYKYLSQTEKEFLYYFKQINESYRWELLEFAKILAKKQ